MSDSHTGFIVTLTHPFHEDDARRVKAAILCLSGVANVTPVVQDIGHSMALEAAKHELRMKLYSVLK